MNNGKDLKEESGTYGSDICFPGDQLVAMADGSNKILSEVKHGDQVITIDPATKKSTAVTVSRLVQHEAKNYAITKLLVVASNEVQTKAGIEVILSAKILEATPNHPMLTAGIQKSMGEINIGEEVVCRDENTNSYTNL